MSSFESAAKKLAETSEPYPLDDLPIDSNDEVSWKEIRETYGLTLPELVALSSLYQYNSNNDNSTTMSADKDKKFENKEELKDWLKTRGVDEDDVAEAAEKLFARGFNKPSKLLGITVEEFAEINKTMSGKEDKFSVALIRHLHNKLKEQQQQQVSTCVRRFRCSREIIRAG
eukprot:CAMPEP_0168788318 /NCGR_PEP_ID=MMETSP0725-20121227/12269_1 /TAXON_ID=265536 /ORGANISM="Amphiprora sp., Strain CCMP467" /LENGTH=171 /DNA_ID=CAMNT_0008838581 /DNA_START=277 /DNA_END=790 /DNA_ORIENTATION=+